jgi:hypothetical protein
MSDFIRVPLAAAVAALTLTGCNMSSNCKDTTAAKTPAATTQAASTGKGSAATSETRVRKTVVTRTVRHPVRRDRAEGGYRYRETGYSGGRGYVGSGVSVTESETYSSRYRSSETSESYGSRGGYAYGSSSASGGGYASTGGGLYAPPPPTAGYPAQHPGYNLAATDRNGYLTWPGKVE